MQVKLEKSYPIEAPIVSAWELLQDIKGVAECMPGAAITEQVDATHYKGTVKVKLGPTTASFKGDIEIRGLDAATRQLQLYGKGTDVKGTSSAAMDLTATLVEYRSVADPVVQQVASVDGVDSVSPELVLPATATGTDGEQIDLLLHVLAPDAPWVPSIESGTASVGLVLAQSASSDLGIGPGDTVRLRHPELVPGSGAEPSIRYTDSDVAVVGTHPFPIRLFRTTGCRTVAARRRNSREPVARAFPGKRAASLLRDRDARRAGRARPGRRRPGGARPREGRRLRPGPSPGSRRRRPPSPRCSPGCPGPC